MKELPIPETETAVNESNGQWSFVLKETCQRLERERDEARDKLHMVLKLLDDYDQAVKNSSSSFWDAFKKWFTFGCKMSDRPTKDKTNGNPTN